MLGVFVLRLIGLAAIRFSKTNRSGSVRTTFEDVVMYGLNIRLCWRINDEG